MSVRLQKLLAAAGLASRRGAEEWIRAGRVRVNGQVAELGQRVDAAQDEIRVDGKRVEAEPLRYWMLHKPAGVLTTTRDPHARPMERRTVLDLLPASARRVRLFPVGRLDLESEGLLLLTNDGDVAQALLHPSRGSEREYRVSVRGALSVESARQLARGLVLDDGPMAPCRVGPRRFDRRRGLTTFSLILREGRKRQIRRALAQLGHPVLRLLRTRMGPVHLGRLPSGAARPLRPAERAALLRQSQGKPLATARRSPRRSA